MSHVIGDGYSLVDWTVTGIYVASLTLQAYLLYLIIYVSPQAMKEYRPFLLLITLWDMVLTAMELSLTPDLLYPASCLLVNGPIGYLGPDVSLFAADTVLFAAANAATQQNFSLAYRLTVCMQSDKWKRRFLDKRTVLLVQLVINGSLFALIFYYSTTFLSDEGTNEYLRGYTNGQERYADGTTVLLPPFNVNRTILCNIMSPPEKIRYLLAMIGALIVFTEAFGISLASAIFIILRRNSKYFTAQTRRMHAQLTALLVMQLLSPLLCMAFPLVNMLVQLISGAPNGQRTGEFNVLAFAVYGFSNTALTLLFVTPYRRHLFGTVFRIRTLGTTTAGSGPSSKPLRRDAWN